MPFQADPRSELDQTQGSETVCTCDSAGEAGVGESGEQRSAGWVGSSSVFLPLFNPQHHREPTRSQSPSGHPMLLSLVSLAEEELKGCRTPLPDPGARPPGEATPALLLNDMVLTCSLRSSGHGCVVIFSLFPLKTNCTPATRNSKQPALPRARLHSGCLPTPESTQHSF